MLEKFKSFENLGTPKYLSELCNKLTTNKKWTQQDVNDYFLHRTIDGRYIFDWWLYFLLELWIIHEDNNILWLNHTFEKVIDNQKQFEEKVLEKIFEKLKSDKIYNEIFSPDNISYDIIKKEIEIDNAAFTLAYSNFKQLLIDFKFLSSPPEWFTGRLIINPLYRNMFDQKLLPDIRKKKMSLENLKKKLLQQQIDWEEAEEAVLKYERERLGKENCVEHISPYYVGAGYDILSCHSIDSKNQDRFIEVKSFKWKVSFYFTRNEIEQARIRQDDYYIYLIDRDKMGKSDYEPIIIKNPYENILKNNKNRVKEIDTYYITKI